MQEGLKTKEVVGNVAKVAGDVGHFVVERLAGGGWSDLPHAEPGPVVRPQRALRIPANIIRGEE